MNDKGGALSDREILEAIEEQAVFISPFNPKNLANSSYDLTLGRYFYRKRREQGSVPVFNPYDPDHVRRVWGGPEACKTAIKCEQWQRENEFILKNIPPEAEIIVIDPGETILAHTREFVGGSNAYITTMMKARSTVGRIAIEVCKCAGWGDIGYHNRWTMEITNNNQDVMIPLVVGWRYSQLVFIRTGGTDRPYYEKGKYQNSKYHELSADELERKWHPSAMLPKMYEDWEVKEYLQSLAK